MKVLVFGTAEVEVELLRIQPKISALIFKFPNLITLVLAVITFFPAESNGENCFASMSESFSYSGGVNKNDDTLSRDMLRRIYKTLQDGDNVIDAQDSSIFYLNNEYTKGVYSIDKINRTVVKQDLLGDLRLTGMRHQIGIRGDILSIDRKHIYRVRKSEKDASRYEIVEKIYSEKIRTGDGFVLYKKNWQWHVIGPDFLNPLVLNGFGKDADVVFAQKVDGGFLILADGEIVFADDISGDISFLRGGPKNIEGKVKIFQNGRDALVPTSSGVWYIKYKDKTAFKIKGLPDDGEYIVSQFYDKFLIGTSLGLYIFGRDFSQPKKILKGAEVSRIVIHDRAVFIISKNSLYILLKGDREPKYHGSIDWRINDIHLSQKGIIIEHSPHQGRGKLSYYIINIYDGGYVSTRSVDGVDRMLQLGKYAVWIRSSYIERVWNHEERTDHINIKKNVIDVKEIPSGTVILTSDEVLLWGLDGSVTTYDTIVGREKTILSVGVHVLLETSSDIWTMQSDDINNLKISVVHPPQRVAEPGSSLLVQFQTGKFACRGIVHNMHHVVSLHHEGLDGWEKVSEQSAQILIRRIGEYESVGPYTYLSTFSPTNQSPNRKKGEWEVGRYQVRVRSYYGRLIDNKYSNYPFYESTIASFSVSPTSALEYFGPFIVTAQRTGIILFKFHLIIFLFLVFGAKYSSWCIEVLVNDSWKYFKLYYRIAVLYVPFFRRRVFGRYYTEKARQVRAAGSVSHDYLPIVLTNEEGGGTSLSDEVLVMMRRERRIWFCGEPGTGKTAMIEAMERLYFGHRNGRKARKRYKFILIVVNVRDYPSLTDSPDKPWAVEMVQRALYACGLPIRDSDYLRRMLESGDFAIVFEGMNETDKDSALQLYANTVRNNWIVATSQTAPSGWSVPTWRLPLASSSFVKELLVKLLDEGRGMRAFEALSADLLGEIRSGYDIALIADLVRNERNIPDTRIKLYDETFKIGGNSENHYDYELCRMSWEMVLAGSRRIMPGIRLTEETIGQFVRNHVLVKRRDAYEFRHDLMRGYAAARWLVFHSQSIQDTTQRMSVEQFWKPDEVRTAERIEIIRFLTQMINQQNDMFVLRAFAESDMKRRVDLWLCVKEATEIKGWPWPSVSREVV